ncbi:MAG TPA: hypothetical protein PL045_10915, partial [Chitinophagaceae bacterium]|nr:hypothetical protein [Chitinophagaceae bacterium]
EVDLFGGAITNFQLHGRQINPLSFQFTKEQMPANNKAGAAYQGHFLCAGRWGEPSSGEIEAGIPNHGEPANILWHLKNKTEDALQMKVHSSKEGLLVARSLQLSNSHALFSVKETVTNRNILGRLFNIVQHPTIAAPFLDENTIVNSNADKGFEYRNGNAPEQHLMQWPNVVDDAGNEFDLRNSTHIFNSVYSFIVKPGEKYGWITAYSPMHQLIFGYIWQQKDFPWINLWQHFENGKIKYRGMEFGTTGLHLPFQTIWKNNLFKVLDENTAAYIDAGEKISYEYAAFLCATTENITGVKNVAIANNMIYITTEIPQLTIEAGNINFSNSNDIQ